MKETVSSNSGFFNWIQQHTTVRLTQGKQGIVKIRKNASFKFIEYFKRHQLRKLLTRSPGELDDIGISHQDLKSALELPLDENASVWLHSRRSAKDKI